MEKRETAQEKDRKVLVKSGKHPCLINFHWFSGLFIVRVVLLSPFDVPIMFVENPRVRKLKSLETNEITGPGVPQLYRFYCDFFILPKNRTFHQKWENTVIDAHLIWSCVLTTL